MRIFLSYASEDRQLAEEILLSLVGEGHEVFFDAESLPPGGDYQSRIREAVESSDCLIFLISPESVATKSYALTELGYARAKWSHPRGRVVPVIGRHTEFESIPAYLKAVTILETKGNLAAEVSSAIAKLHAQATTKQNTQQANAGHTAQHNVGALHMQKPGHNLWRVAIVIVSLMMVAISVHMLNPLFVNFLGQLGPLGAHFAYIPNRAQGYEKAVDMIREAHRSNQNHIINLRTTQSNPEQDRLYKEIVAALSGSRIQYTRVVFYEADPNRDNTRWFLKELGNNRSFRLKMILDVGGLPSCVITDRAAIIGFNDGSGRLSNSLYIEKPADLVRDIRDTYLRVIESERHTITFKDFDEIIENDEIDKVIADKEADIKKAIGLLKRAE